MKRVVYVVLNDFFKKQQLQEEIEDKFLLQKSLEIVSYDDVEEFSDAKHTVYLLAEFYHMFVTKMNQLMLDEDSGVITKMNLFELTKRQ